MDNNYYDLLIKLEPVFENDVHYKVLVTITDFYNNTSYIHVFSDLANIREKTIYLNILKIFPILKSRSTVVKELASRLSIMCRKEMSIYQICKHPGDEFITKKFIYNRNNPDKKFIIIIRNIIADI